MGPFHCNPFNANCVVSPLMCVPKRDSTDLRIVHDLSFSAVFQVANFRILFSLKIFTPMNWNSLLLWSPPNCGHASLRATKYSCFRVSSCVSLINSQYSTNLFMQQCLRELWLLLALFNIQLVVRHVRGCHNWLAASLSSFHTEDLSAQFHALSTRLQFSECPVPEDLFHFTVTQCFPFIKFLFLTVFPLQKAHRLYWNTPSRFSRGHFKSLRRGTWELSWTRIFYFVNIIT